MSDAKLMMPLFCNGMFNCGGRRIRAVHLYDVSDGEHRYRLWTKAGTPDSRIIQSHARRSELYQKDSKLRTLADLIRKKDSGTLWKSGPPPAGRKPPAL